MKIRSICAELFGFKGELDWTNPVAIRVELRSNYVVRVRCSSDGESIIADEHALDDPVDMEQFGKIEVHSLTNRIDEVILRSDIAMVNEVLDGNNCVVGLAFISEPETTLCIWNYGDELHYGNFTAMSAQDWGSALRLSRKSLCIGLT